MIMNGCSLTYKSFRVLNGHLSHLQFLGVEEVLFPIQIGALDVQGGAGWKVSKLG